MPVSDHGTSPWPHLDIDSRNQPQYSISPLVQLVVATKGGIRFGVRRQSLDIFAGLAACSNLRELYIDRISLIGSRHACTLPRFPCHHVLPSISRVSFTSSFSITGTLAATHVFFVLAHMPRLEDLRINCTNFSPNLQPDTFVPVSLKRYSFHHWGWGDGREGSMSSGWSLPLQSSRISIRELELTIKGAEDLVELLSAEQYRSANITGASFFPKLRIVKLSIAWLQNFSILAPLLAQCPRVQTLHLIADVAYLPQLPPFAALVNILPTAGCLKHLAIGLRMWNEYYHIIEPTLNQSTRMDKELRLQLLQLSGIHGLKSFTVLVDPENYRAFRLPRIQDECRQRRIPFCISPTIQMGGSG